MLASAVRHEKEILLQHVADVLRLTDDLPAMPTDAPGIGRQQATERVEQCGLATAGGTDNADDLPLAQRQAQIGNHRDDLPVEVVAFGDMLDHEREGGAVHGPSLSGLRVCGSVGDHFRLAIAFSANELSMI